jgi:hypothetical protein
MTDQAARPAPGKRAVPAQRVVLTGLAMLSVLAAVIHFAVAGSHFQEYWLFGVFMLGVAWLQLGWAARCWTPASRSPWFMQTRQRAPSWLPRCTSPRRAGPPRSPGAASLGGMCTPTCAFAPVLALSA